jgi:hypothetical protein
LRSCQFAFHVFVSLFSTQGVGKNRKTTGIDRCLVCVSFAYAADSVAIDSLRTPSKPDPSGSLPSENFLPQPSDENRTTNDRYRYRESIKYRKRLQCLKEWNLIYDLQNYYVD